MRIIFLTPSDEPQRSYCQPNCTKSKSNPFFETSTDLFCARRSPQVDRDFW
ncbi:MAG: hypothetical protein SWY16_12010 [Cyanobacteriota bacterium]|nr:hypothetical protein [Cyanobacteriota bacterium]